MTDVSRDPRVQEFLELVNCEPSEVLDVPLGRLLPTEELTSGFNCDDPEVRHRSVAHKQVYFGKHKGKKLKDVPLSYLEWALGEKATSNSFRRFQRDVRQILGRDNCDLDVEPQNPLDREFFAIIGKPDCVPEQVNVADRCSRNQRSAPRPPGEKKLERTRRKNSRQQRSRGNAQADKNQVNVACTRCSYHKEMSRLVFGRESRRASRCRCPLCGGNVVLAKYAR